MTPQTDLDRDALRRAVEWGKDYQRREPQIKVFPSPMPLEGSPEWIELATYLAVHAQVQALGLRPWETVPCQTENCDDAHINPNGWGNRPDEVALLRKMIRLGISIYEPDPPAAISRAEHGRAARTATRS